MSVATEYERIKNGKESLKTALNAILPAGHKITNEKINNYYNFIQYLETGGSQELPTEIDVILAGTYNILTEEECTKILNGTYVYAEN